MMQVDSAIDGYAHPLSLRKYTLIHCHDTEVFKLLSSIRLPAVNPSEDEHRDDGMLLNALGGMERAEGSVKVSWVFAVRLSF